MQLKVFSVPAEGGDEAVEEMNKFLRAHRVLSIEKRMVEQGGAYWSFCVEYLERGGGGGGPGSTDRSKRGVDYKEPLRTVAKRLQPRYPWRQLEQQPEQRQQQQRIPPRPSSTRPASAGPRLTRPPSRPRRYNRRGKEKSPARCW